MSFNHPIEASVTIDIGEEDKKEKDVLEEEMKEKEKDEISASRYESEKEPTKRRSANRLIHTIRKVKFLAKIQKFNFHKTPTFSRVFHPKSFLAIFLVKSKLSTAKKPKTTTFSRVFQAQIKLEISK